MTFQQYGTHVHTSFARARISSETSLLSVRHVNGNDPSYTKAIRINRLSTFHFTIVYYGTINEANVELMEVSPRSLILPSSFLTIIM